MIVDKMNFLETRCVSTKRVDECKRVETSGNDW